MWLISCLAAMATEHQKETWGISVTETVGENCCISGVELRLKQRDSFRLLITLKIPIFPKASPVKSGGGLRWAPTTSSHQGAPRGVAWKRPWRFICLLGSIKVKAQEVDVKASIDRRNRGSCGTTRVKLTSDKLHNHHRRKKLLKSFWQMDNCERNALKMA